MKVTKAGFLAALAVTGAVTVLACGGPSAVAGTSAGHSGSPVVVIGIGGLRWSDISPSSTPAIWRLAESGSVGSLVTTSVHPVTCPDDAWLTLNAGRRAAAPPGRHLACPPVPVARGSGQVRAMKAVTVYNEATSYQPRFGTLASIHAGCASAIGPGAALALADASGRVGLYSSALRPATGGTVNWAAFELDLTNCPLTVVDLGNLPASSARPGLVASADKQVGRIVEAVSPAVVVVAGLGDDGSPHLRAIVVAGPGYHTGLLTSGATRQPGVVTITDLTPSIFGWRGQRPPAGLVGSPITSAPRGPLAQQVKTMLGQDTANQVYRSIVGWFFLYLGVGEAAAFALIALLLRGRSPAQRGVPGGRPPAPAQRLRRRVVWYTAAGAFGAALPAGTFLAGLVPWGQFGHPAVWLYGLGSGWAALIAVGALIGPWRKNSFGPVGFVCAVTLGVIGIDVITGSHLQIGAPFGLSLVEAGRLYGVGNNALGVYLVAGQLTAAWAAVSVLRRPGGTPAHGRRSAVLAAAAVAVATVIASGWPGFGAKVGGTIAMVPAYLVLLAAIGGVKITARRGLAIAVSGIALVTVFAVLDYLLPAIGPSHLGGFVGQLVHGGASATLHRKISSNLHSLIQTWYTPFVPFVAVVTGLMLAWPERMRQRSFVVAIEREPLIRPILFVVWLAVVLGWLADDSGVSVAAAALPVALPLAIVLVVRIVSAPVTHDAAEREANLTLQGPAHGRFG